MSDRTPEQLYQLSVIADNPFFEGFAVDEAPSILGRDCLDDDMTPGYEIANSDPQWIQPRLEPHWSPPTVTGRVAPFNDFPGIDMTLPAFSKRACELLKEFLEPNGELLPVHSQVGEYFFYNVTTISNALDIENSICDFWCDPPTTATNIDYFAFDRDKLKGLSIFRIHQQPMEVIVSDLFVQRVNECGLNGFNFVKTWPFPKGTDWRTEGRNKVRQIMSDDLKKHSLVLIFRFDPSKKNQYRKLVAAFENQLDAQLAVSSIDTPFFGWYEGIDTVDDEFRLFLSCPDVDLLEQKLQPWLEHLDWHTQIQIIKRFGGMHDRDAKTATKSI